MLTVVSTKAQRLLRILNNLPKNYGFLSYEAIQNANACSINTAYADAKYILDQWGDVLDLKLVDKGIITLNKSDSDFEYVRKCILRDEFELHLIWYIFTKPNLTTMEYSTILCCSESHFRKTIKTINQKFVKYEIKITYDEKTRTWRYGAKSPVMGAQMIARIVEICDFDLPQKYTIDYDTYLTMYGLKDLEVPKLMSRSFGIFHAILRHYLELNSRYPELDFAAICRERSENLIPYEAFEAYLQSRLEAVRREAKSKHISVDKGDRNLFSFVYFLYMRDTFYDIWITNETGRFDTTLHRFKNENEELIRIINEEVRNLDKHFEINTSQFMSEIILWVYVNMQFDKLTLVNRILIISDLGHSHQRIFKDFIKDHLPKINVIEDLSTNSIDLKPTDLVITNSKKHLIDRGLKHAKYVIVSDILTIDEIVSIYTAVFNIHDKRRVYER